MHNDETRPPELELLKVSAWVQDFRTLDDISIVFPAGTCSVILGAAGSGKSTLVKVCAGLVIPQEGKILLDGKNLLALNTRQELRFRASSGFVFQDSALWQDTNILNNVAMPLKVHHPGMDQKQLYSLVNSCLRRVGYNENINLRPADLSTGEQKLVSIARAIVHEPQLLFMDDPTSNLDEDAADRVYQILEELKAAGTTIIIATNNSELAYRFADMLGVIKTGKLLAFGAYEETLGKVEHVLSSSLARLKARGRRGSGDQTASAPGTEAKPSTRSEL